MRKVIFALSLVGAGLAQGGQFEEKILTEAQTARLTIAVQYETNVALSVENLRLKLTEAERKHQEAARKTSAVFEAVCLEIGADPITAKPTSDLRKILIPQKAEEKQ